MIDQKKIALITGSSRGIGRETALVLAQAGYHVILHGKNPERLKATVELFVEQGFTIDSYAADITNIEEVTAMFSWIKKRAGTN